jgi:DNA polymerase-3 subunit gamma/tau
MSYLVYARKYRPKTFEEMIGQKAVVQTLQNAVKNDRVAQAYIFSGMRGVGKTTAARILAKTLNCEHGPTPQPCNNCSICNEINEDRSIDVMEIDGASNTSVDDVRALREGVQYKPIHCRNKIIIIDEIHMLSKSAFNALLKTLEEPPPNTVFIFATTEFHKVPATIVSRCQHFEFKKISHKEIREHIQEIAEKENIQISPFGLNLIASAAEGSLRDAQSLLDQAVAFSGENITDEDLKEILGTINRELLYSFSSAILEMKPEKIYDLVEQMIDSGYDLRYFYAELIRHFRDLLLVSSINKANELLTYEEKEITRLKEEANKAGSNDLLRCLLSLQEGEPGLKFSSHPRILLESILIKLCHYKRLVPIEELIQDVKKLTQDLSDDPHELTEPSSIRKVSTGEKTGYNKSSGEPGTSQLNQNISGPERDLEKTEEKKKFGSEADLALKDPSVQSFMKKFKAQIISVEPEANKKK